MDTPVTPASDSDTPGVEKHTVAFLIVFYAVATVSGAFDAAEVPDRFSIVVSMTAGLNLAVWAVLDAKRHGRPIPLLAQPWFVIFSAVLVPGYAIYSRGWRGVGWVVLHGIGYLLTNEFTFFLLQDLGSLHDSTLSTAEPISN